MEYKCDCGTIRTLDEEGYRVLKQESVLSKKTACKNCTMWVRGK